MQNGNKPLLPWYLQISDKRLTLLFALAIVFISDCNSRESPGSLLLRASLLVLLIMLALYRRENKVSVLVFSFALVFGSVALRHAKDWFDTVQPGLWYTITNLCILLVGVIIVLRKNRLTRLNSPLAQKIKAQVAAGQVCTLHIPESAVSQIKNGNYLMAKHELKTGLGLTNREANQRVDEIRLRLDLGQKVELEHPGQLQIELPLDGK